MLINNAMPIQVLHSLLQEKSKDSSNAAKVLKSWAEAEWFTSKPEVPQSITTTVFKVPGETNTDDLSPAPDAWSRPDIPLHALAMYKIQDKVCLMILLEK